MIVYNSTKAQFSQDVTLNRISDMILQNLREKNVAGGQHAEYMSWQNSLQYMRNVIDDPEIPGDVQVAVEYQIPRTSKRVDFMIGNDLRFDPCSGKVITDPSKISKDDKSSGIRSADPLSAERLIKNTYKTLLTRGQKGCYIYCEDEALASYIRSALK